MDLTQLSAGDSYKRTSGSGFGTRMLCRPLSEHNDSPTDGDLWLHGLRNVRALNTMTNDVPNSHMQSPGRFLEIFPGMRDPGEIGFEANWKNDDDAQMKWQRAKEGDTVKGFFHSIFFDAQPFEAWVIPPEWTNGLIIVRGHARMLGPFNMSMESPVNFQAAFRASGIPQILFPNEDAASFSVTGITAAGVLTALSDAPYLNKRYRYIKGDGSAEYWSNMQVSGSNPPAFDGTDVGADAITLADDAGGKLIRYDELPNWAP